jgi:hypothetical protein
MLNAPEPHPGEPWIAGANARGADYISCHQQLLLARAAQLSEPLLVCSLHTHAAVLTPIKFIRINVQLCGNQTTTNPVFSLTR